jgi:hypothetical protein
MGAGPQTSVWMSSKGQVERERDTKNGNCLDLELRHAEHGSVIVELETGS